MNLETRKPGIELGNTDLTGGIIAAAIRVHKELGPGFLEKIQAMLTDDSLDDGLLLNFASVKLTVKRVSREYRPRSLREDITF